ncbi:MAG: tRNA pseudouridine(55) synthase TruB [Byssovorax sp.]
MKQPSRGPSGLLIVDKPVGPTSHDLVGKVRRALGTRKVGHAGTLDPAASGVLVVLVGEATKLGPYLTSHAKRYTARIVFGLSTDTLDREGQPTATAEPPAWLREELMHVVEGGPAPLLGEALAAETARALQAPPAYSAIKVQGTPSYARARAGEAVELAERPVSVQAIAPLAADASAERPTLDLDLRVSKGYYVRSLARDLGERLGVPSHLGALRRTESGPFKIDQAVPLAGLGPGALIALTDAARLGLSAATLTAAGVYKARCGQRLGEDDFEVPAPIGEPSAWLDAAGELIAVGERSAEGLSILRGFGGSDQPENSADPPLGEDG